MLLAAALAAVTIATVPVTVHWDEGGCPDSINDGCYVAATNEIWVQPGTGARALLWHERGHAFDRQRLDAGERNRFSCLPAVKPYVDGDPALCHAEWSDGPEEMFADAYANCGWLRKPSSVLFDGGSGYNPTLRQHLNACRFIERAADLPG